MSDWDAVTAAQSEHSGAVVCKVSRCDKAGSPVYAARAYVTVRGPKELEYGLPLLVRS